MLVVKTANALEKLLYLKAFFYSVGITRFREIPGKKANTNTRICINFAKWLLVPISISCSNYWLHTKVKKRFEGHRWNHLVFRKNSKKSLGNCHDACNLNTSLNKDSILWLRKPSPEKLRNIKKGEAYDYIVNYFHSIPTWTCIMILQLVKIQLNLQINLPSPISQVKPVSLRDLRFSWVSELHTLLPDPPMSK